MVVEEAPTLRAVVSFTLWKRVEGKGEANSWHGCCGSATSDLYPRTYACKHTNTAGHLRMKSWKSSSVLGVSVQVHSKKIRTTIPR